MGSIDVDGLNAASEVLWDREFRLLHTHRFAATDSGQVQYLMHAYRPHGEVLDVGCGFGTVARLMADMGAPANFTLLNISDYQLSKCPKFMTKICANAEHMPFPNESFDGAMANSSLMNMDREAALAECNRVLRMGGKLMLSDAVIPVAARGTYDAAAMQREMHANVTSAYKLIKDIYHAGFRVYSYDLPAGDTRHMEDLGEVVERLFKPLRPIILLAEKNVPYRDPEKARAWRLANPQSGKKAVARWQAKNPEYFKKWHLANGRKSKYGMDGIDLLATQKGCCGICSVNLVTAPTHLRHLDHCHASGEVRGWLCHRCNQGLGGFRDSPELVLKALAYLEQPPNGRICAKV